MRLTTFTDGNTSSYGVVLRDRVLDLRVAMQSCWGYLDENASKALATVPVDLLDFIMVGEVAYQAARKAMALAIEGRLPKSADGGDRLWHEMGTIRMLAPIARPGKILAIGLNYSDHAAESGMSLPKNPVIFAKFATSIAGPGEAVIHPGQELTSQLDYEIELAVVIGKTTRHVAVEHAMKHVFGYAIMNDISARDLQFEDGQWLKGKALDTFAPFGPFLVTADEIPDPHALDMRLTLNGQLMQCSNTANMVFTVPRLVSYLSQLMTLEPGDVISTGTPAGVGFGRRPSVFLWPGDVVSAEIEGLGVLTNPVVGR